MISIKKIEKQITVEEEKLETEDDTETKSHPPKNIFTYNELRSCADIYRMFTEGELNKAPSYQRDDVWTNAQQSRFIDSLAKRLPIPSMCFSYDIAVSKFEVIDGRQRISTILKFLDPSNEAWVLSELDDIDKELSGKSVKQIKENSPHIYSAIKNLSIPVTVVNCDLSRDDNMEYIFKIFHRLNTGGVSLSNQEIRNCIFSGSLNDLLNELNQNSDWKKWAKSISTAKRFKGQERILTFIAAVNDEASYNGKMTSFLNNFMKRHRSAHKNFIAKQKDVFCETVKICSNIKPKGFKNVYVDAILYGVSLNLNNCKNKTPEDLQSMYEKLLTTDAFRPEKLQEGLAKSFMKRLKAAKDIFGE